NTATVSGGGESNTANNSDTETTSTNGRAPDVVVEKPRNGPLTPGQNANVTITVTNNGNADATGVGFTDDLPDGVTWVEGLDLLDKCDIVANDLVCSDISLAKNGGAYTVAVQANVDAEDCPAIVNPVFT